MMVKKKGVLCIGVSLAVIFVVWAIFFRVMTPSDRYAFTQNPVGHRILANWHSARKIVNLVHLPYWFRRSRLPTYHIGISPTNEQEMNQQLPKSPDGLRFGRLTDAYKHYVSAQFSYRSEEGIEYSEKVDIRYRGTNHNNWDAEKKAYRVKFPKSHFFQGSRALNFFLPYDRAYFGEPLAAYRAQKFGLLEPGYHFVRLMINGRNQGISLAAQPWSKELLAHRNQIDTNNIFSNRDISFRAGEEQSLFASSSLHIWKSYIAEDEVGDFRELATLISLVESAPDDEFMQKIPALVDVEKLYAWQLINMLHGSNHQTDTGNMVLLFQQERGMFELVPWDVNLYGPDEYNFEQVNRIVDRVFAQPTYWKAFQEFARDYLEDEQQVADDLAFYDNLVEQMRPEFYADQAKLHTDLVFNRKIEEGRMHIQENFEHAKRLLDRDVFHQNRMPYVPSGAFHPAGTFERFNELFFTRNELLARYPLLQPRGDGVAIPAGNYRLSETIIIPRGLPLTLDPGVTLRFDDGISLISYSPVQALGTALQPIRFEDATPTNDDAWGVFAVVNTGDALNSFRHLQVSGGSIDYLNGIFFTGPFSLHNVHSEIAESTFEGSTSDDGIHVIQGTVQIRDSVLKNHAADAIDLDFVTNSEIIRTRLTRESDTAGNGDGIDFSGTAQVFVTDVHVEGFGDKCLSVGEQAWVKVTGSVMKECAIGLAVKDRSEAHVIDSVFEENAVAVHSYQKKQTFERGGNAYISRTHFDRNTEDVKEEDGGIIVVEESL